MPAHGSGWSDSKDGRGQEINIASLGHPRRSLGGLVSWFRAPDTAGRQIRDYAENLLSIRTCWRSSSVAHHTVLKHGGADAEYRHVQSSKPACNDDLNKGFRVPFRSALRVHRGLSKQR